MNVSVIMWLFGLYLVLFALSLQWTQVDSADSVEICNGNSTPCLTDTNQIIYHPAADEPQYKLHEYQAERLSTWALKYFVALARSFVVGLNNIDFGFLVGLYTNQIPFEMPAVILTLANMEMLLAGGTAFGLVLAVLLLITGCITCCCRCCCKKCGAPKSLSKPPELSLCCSSIIIALFSMSWILMVVGIGAIFTVAQRLPSTGEFTVQSIYYAMQDITSFEKYLFGQLRSVATDDLSFTRNVLYYKLDHMAEEVTGPFMNESKPMIDALTTTVVNFNDGVISTSNALDGTTTSITDLQTIAALFTSQISNIRTALTNAYNTCTGNSTLDAIAGFCPGLVQSADIPTMPDFSNMPSITDQEALVADTYAVNLTSLIGTVNTTFNDLPSRVQTEAEPTVEASRSAIDSINSSSITPMINSSQEQINKGMSSLDGMNHQMLPYVALADEYTPQLSMGFMCLGVPIILVLITAFLGCCFGSLFSMSKKETYQKFRRCAYCSLITSSALSVIVGVLYLFVGAILFFIGGNITLVCQGFIDFSFFREFVDNPSMWNDSYMISQMLFGNGSYPFTAEEALTACRDNQAVYKALHLDQLIDIESILDIQSQIPDLSDFDDIAHNAMGGFTLLDSQTRSDLHQVQYNSANTTSYAVTRAELVSDMGDTAVISTVKQNIWNAYTNILAIAGDGTLSAEYLAIHDNINIVDTVTLPALERATNLLANNLTFVEDGVGTIVGCVSNIVTGAGDMQTFLDGGGRQLVAESVTLFGESLLDIAGQVTDHINKLLDNDVGHCGVVYEVYMGFINTFCYYFLDAFNGFWLALCVCGVVCVLNFALSLVLARYTSFRSSSACV